MRWNYFSISKLQWLHHWSLGMDKQFHLKLYNGCNYLSMLGLKLNHVSKKGLRDYISHGNKKDECLFSNCGWASLSQSEKTLYIQSFLLLAENLVSHRQKISPNFELANHTHQYTISPLWAVLEIPTGPRVRGRQLWRRTGNFLLFFFNFMFMIWDSWHEDLHLFDWVSNTAYRRVIYCIYCEYFSNKWFLTDRLCANKREQRHSLVPIVWAIFLFCMDNVWHFCPHQWFTTKQYYYTVKLPRILQPIYPPCWWKSLCIFVVRLSISVKLFSRCLDMNINQAPIRYFAKLDPFIME